jgi:hypothetical protein
MSGGHFNHKQYHIESIIEELQFLIDTNNSDELDDWGDPVGRQYSDETIAKFKKGLESLRTACVYTQRIDWLVSGDDSEESFHRRLESDLQN